MKWSGAHRWALLTVLASVAGVSALPCAPAEAVAKVGLRQTTSHYEQNAKAGRLYLQGRYAGKAAAQGIVILDFGRPAFDGQNYGTIDFSDSFVSLAEITRAVEFYIMGYYRYAPSYTSLYVAIGTNNSCGTGQPCGTTICGCTDEPPDYKVWGSQFALMVEAVGRWSAMVKAEYGYTDQIQVVGGDDAEPAYDPGYTNTYDVLEGYSATVGGAVPAMVDYGSAEAHYWTEQQLFQVAYGFRPDVAMPEVYYQDNAAEWAALLSYAKDKLGRVMDIYGVLAGGPGTNSPAAAYTDMLQAASGITHQSSIPWLSTIMPEVAPATIEPAVAASALSP